MKRRTKVVRSLEAGSRRKFSRVVLAAVAFGAVAVGAVAIGCGAIRGLGARRQWGIYAEMPEVTGGPIAFDDVLRGHRYMNLTTFRKSGEAVSTTVWFALVDGIAYVTTDPRSGKVKRIRNDPRVVLTPSNAWGRLRGAPVEGVGWIFDGGAPGCAERALGRKYRAELAVLRFLGQKEIGRITLEIRPDYLRVES